MKRFCINLHIEIKTHILLASEISLYKLPSYFGIYTKICNSIYVSIIDIPNIYNFNSSI